MDFGVVFEPRSVLVAHVESGSLADSLGIRPGERLTHLNAIPVCNPDQLAAMWRDRQPGRATLSVWRDGQVREVDLNDLPDLPQHLSFAERALGSVTSIRGEVDELVLVDSRRRVMADLIERDPAFTRERTRESLRHLMEAFEAMEHAIAGRALAAEMSAGVA